ncbi:class I SAM-dependent methyltransferase [Streptomyces sp. NPDC006879]|uniref:class I SAM-dependent methyltransferase n=1 Tax=Streptomyces sp. NPDC006879 TaxID=3364767 RepID=UPI0036CDDB30
MENERFDVWAVGGAYQRYMGRWSSLVAEEFTAWLNCPDGLRYVDVGCGTGALSAVVAARCRPRSVVGADRSEGFVRSARRGAPAPACFVVADAMSLPLRAAACDVALSGLALNFFPAATTAVAEMARVVRPGGLIAGYVWDYAGGMELLRSFWDAAVGVDASASPWDEARRFSLCRPEALREVWGEAGLVEVSTTSIEVPTVFPDFADLWEPLLAGQGPAPSYVATLAPADRERVRHALSDALARRPDGSIRLAARAWAVRGRRAVDATQG